MELKPQMGQRVKWANLGSNRTFMELKPSFTNQLAGG